MSFLVNFQKIFLAQHHHDQERNLDFKTIRTICQYNHRVTSKEFGL
jgi:hypothetical protein